MPTEGKVSLHRLQLLLSNAAKSTKEQAEVPTPPEASLPAYGGMMSLRSRERCRQLEFRLLQSSASVQVTGKDGSQDFPLTLVEEDLFQNAAIFSTLRIWGDLTTFQTTCYLLTRRSRCNEAERVMKHANAPLLYWAMSCDTR